MATWNSIRESFLSSFGKLRAPLDPPALRALCMAMLADVPAADREAMLQRLGQMRRADDLWYLRGALFDIVSRNYGETVARERLTELDSQLR